MKIRLLWALLSWLSLLSFGARAQTNVPLAQETFETDGEGSRYTSNTMGAGNVNTYFERRMFTTPSGATTTYSGAGGSTSPSYVSGQQGSYAWMAERVRGSANTGANANIRVPGYVQLNPITTTNYKNLRVVVAMADPRCSGCSGNTVYYTDRVRVRYSFDGGPFVTAGLLVNSGGTSSLGFWGIDTSTPLDSVSDSNLGTAYRDVTGTISGTGSSLRIQVVVDANLPEITFDNIRVIGDADAGAKPALANIESTTLNYTEGQASPVQVTNSLTVGYSDNSATNITGGTVTISSGFTSGDQLNYSTQGGISGTYSNGVLTLTGTTTQANYQAALRSVTFSNSNTSTLPNGTRQIAFQLSNGTAQSNTPLRNLNVTAVLTTGTLPYTENFNSDGEGTRYFGNSFVRPAVTTGFFRATTSPAYSGSDKIGDLTYTGWSGGYWYGEGTKTGTTGTAIQLAPVNAAGAVGLKFVITVGSSASQTPGSSTSNYNWDAADYFRLYYRTGGSSGTWMEFGSFLPDANGLLRRGGNTDSVVVGQTLRYFTFPLPSQAAVNGVDFQLLQASDGDEELAFDNIRISAAVLPTVTTTTPSNVAVSGATLGGNITSNGDGTLTERGVVYVVGTGTPTTSNTKALVSTSGVTTGAYSGTVSGLSPGTTYTVRAYAINEAGTGYGATQTFTTIAVTPTVTTTAASSVTATSAVLGGNVTADGGATVTGRGVVYSVTSTNVTPVIGGTGVAQAANGSGLGTFSATISSLAPGTSYSVQAYATNSAGTSYGGVQTFTTAAAVPTVTTTAAGSVTATSAVLGGNVTADGGASVTGRGVVYSVTSTNSTPTIGGTGVAQAANGSGTGTFSATISSLAPGTSYSVQAYAINSVGTSYGGVQTFTTSANLATVTTAAAASIMQTSAVLGGNVTADGGASVTGRGVVYSITSTNGTPTIGGTGTTNAPNGSGAGSFSATISGLSAGTSYSVQAYAINSAGTSYGGVQTFTTAAATATVTSIARQTPTVAATATATVSYLVTFSAPVSGVSTGNFSLTQTTSGASITSVSPATGTSTTYTVTVNTGTGNGTLQLNVANATGITPSVTNTPFNGTSAVYTIVKSFSAGPQLSLRAAGSASGAGNDATAFVDGVQIVQNGTSTAVANALQNGSFETNNLGSSASDYLYPATGLVAAPWAFTLQAGVARIGGSGFTPAASGLGSYVGFLQSANGNNGTIAQNLTVPTGTYQVNLLAAQRGNYGASDQVVNVFLNDGTNDVFVGTVQPASTTTYVSFTSAAFSVAAPALTATVSTTSSSPTSTSPIPFSVSFSQSVGTTFIASEVTVTGGAVTSGSFSGSGAGPYTFTVTPTGAGTVTVSVAAGVANDANNTQNTASNSVSVQYQLPVTAAPTLTQPANNSTTNSLPTFAGTAPVGSTVTIYLAAGSGTAQAIGTTTATSGNFSFTPATALASGSYSAYATAQTSGASGSANSNTNTFTVDATAPTVVSSNRQNPAAATTNATSVTFRVTFSEPVMGVDFSDFTATTTGTVTSGSRTVSAVSSSVYDVTVSGVSGNGTVRLDLNASGTGIADAVGNPISGGYTSGQTYTIDQTAPTVALSTTATSPTATSPIPFSATFSETVAGLSASGISVTNGTVTGSTVSGSGSGPYTFTVTPTGGGTVTVSILTNAAQDAAGNGNTASNAVSITYSTVTTWTAGAGTQDWFTAGNWSAGVPTASTDALIPTGVRFYPLVTAAGAVTRNLTINSPGSVTLAIVGTLTVNGLLTNGGTITQSAGALTVNGNVSMSGTINKSAGTISVTGSLSNSGTLNLSGGDFAVSGSLTNNTSGTVSHTGGTLSVNGDLTNNSTFTTTNAQGTGGGTVLLGGGSATSFILGSSAVRFWNLTVQAGGAQLSTSAGASVRNVLTLNGNFATNSNVFTLESASTGTALVVNNGSSVVNGNATVQRYIDPSLNSGPGYRHYSAPVSNTTVGDLTTTGFTPVVNPAYNTAATPTSVRPFPTVFGYDEQRVNLSNSQSAFDRGYVSPTALSDPLTVGRGYTVNIGASELVDFVGPLNNGTLTVPLTSTRDTNPDGGWQLLGNPYPAPLDYRLVDAADRAGLDAAIYVFSSTSQYGGQYRSYVNTFGNSVLPVGQGFFARVSTMRTNPNTSMVFRNSQRLTAPNSTAFQRTTADLRPQVQLTLQGASSPLPDELYVYFEQGASAGFDRAFDAEKLANPSGLNLASSLAAGQGLSIDGRAPLGTAQLVVPLTVGVPTVGSYTLTAAQLLNLSTVPVYLRDKQTGALIDLAQQPSYSFAVSNASALLTGRFELVFSPQQALATVPAALAQQVLVYPNPAKGQVTIELPASLGGQPVTATLVDAVGRPVREQVLPVGRASHTLLLTDLATGVYALRLRTELGTVVRKLVVE